MLDLIPILLGTVAFQRCNLHVHLRDKRKNLVCLVFNRPFFRFDHRLLQRRQLVSSVGQLRSRARKAIFGRLGALLGRSDVRGQGGSLRRVLLSTRQQCLLFCFQASSRGFEFVDLLLQFRAFRLLFGQVGCGFREFVGQCLDVCLVCLNKFFVCIFLPQICPALRSELRSCICHVGLTLTELLGLCLSSRGAGRQLGLQVCVLACLGLQSQLLLSDLSFESRYLCFEPCLLVRELFHGRTVCLVGALQLGGAHGQLFFKFCHPRRDFFVLRLCNQVLYTTMHNTLYITMPTTLYITMHTTLYITTRTTLYTTMHITLYTTLHHTFLLAVG
eukprot:m.677475 g.677475  ORF g.677475 m.677475 type:complete len:331 (-) comp22796_c0_seq3:189-1181(-)